MTFSLLLRQPHTTLLIGASRHAEFNAAMPNRNLWILRRSNWNCNVCGVRLPGLMEIDHLDEHGPGPGGRIAPICQFCHDLKHPLWAATRHRLAPVDIPEIDQRTLTRLCWIMISRVLRDAQDAQRLRPIIRTLVRRRIQAGRMLETLNMTQAFQALISTSELWGTEHAAAIAKRLDSRLRLMPAALFDLSTLCAWKSEGFVPVRRPDLQKALRQPLPPSEAAALLAEAGYLAAQGGGAGTQDDKDDAVGCDAQPDPRPAIRMQEPVRQRRPVEGPAPARSACWAPNAAMTSRPTRTIP